MAMRGVVLTNYRRLRLCKNAATRHDYVSDHLDSSVDTDLRGEELFVEVANESTRCASKCTNIASEETCGE